MVQTIEKLILKALDLEKIHTDVDIKSLFARDTEKTCIASRVSITAE